MRSHGDGFGHTAGEGLSLSIGEHLVHSKTQNGLASAVGGLGFVGRGRDGDLV